MRQQKSLHLARTVVATSIFSLSLLLTACSSDGAIKGPFELKSYTAPNSNAAPTVDAGPDQDVLAGDRVTLSGNAQDDVWVDRIEWRQQSGPDVGVTGAITPQASFVAPAVTERTELRFLLRAFDDQGKVGSDQMSVFVEPLEQPASLRQPETYILDLGSLPSDQGWTFVGSAMPESSVFSIDSDRLVQRTTGSNPLVQGLYQLDRVIDPHKVTVLSVTARVLGYESLAGASTGQAFNFLIDTGEYSYRLALTDHLVQVGGQFYSLNTTDAHDYRLEVTPDGNFHLFVDGDLFAFGAGLASVSGGEIIFGDSAAYESSHVEVFSLSIEVDSI